MSMVQSPRPSSVPTGVERAGDAALQGAPPPPGITGHHAGPADQATSHALSSRRGTKERNEDALAIHLARGVLPGERGTVAIIADGVSTASYAAEASQTAVRSFIADYLSTPETWQTKTAAHRVLTSINRWLYAQGRHLRDAEQGHLTTLTVAVVRSRTAHVFHIGDSRLSLVRRGQLEQITRDHNNQDSSGKCYLTRALGLSLSPRFDYHAVPLEPGDTLLLTTDGIHDAVPNHEIERILADAATLDEAATGLDSLALAHQSIDDRSLIILQLDSLPHESKDEVHRRITSLPVPPDLDPGMILDGLRIEKLLHASSRSQLYVVRDEQSNRRMVMKTPSPNFADDAAYLERFAMEEWIGLRTQNPHLVKAIPRPNKSCLYLLLEYVDGISLATWSTRHPSPEVKEVIRFTRQIIEGSRALHRSETIHQDLKPDNIIIDGSGCIRLIDYGSCRIAAIEETHAAIPREEALGTLDFSAPEYRLHRPATTMADQFSIALITYHLLTGGAHPFPRGWPRARTHRQFLQLRYRPASRINPHVTDWIDAALHKAVSIDPADRYESLSEFLHDLNHPNPAFTRGRSHEPLAQRNPVLVWQLIALAFLVAWIVTLLMD